MLDKREGVIEVVKELVPPFVLLGPPVDLGARDQGRPPVLRGGCLNHATEGANVGVALADKPGCSHEAGYTGWPPWSRPGTRPCCSVTAEIVGDRGATVRVGKPHEVL